jgi:hypothetical protein
VSLPASDWIGGLLVIALLAWAFAQRDDRRGGGSMIAWIFSLLVALAPPGRVPARETEDAALVRYASIAEDLDEVIASEPPLPGLSRAQTAALLVAIAVHESGLRLDVDQGLIRGEGQDLCLMQIRSYDEALLDRKTCFRRGLAMARASWNACPGGERERLRVYASGTCIAGSKESHAFIDSWRRALAAHPPPPSVAPSIAFALEVRP